MSALDLGRARPLLIGVVHLAATPGAPRYRGQLGDDLGGEIGGLLERAAADARAWLAGGADALVVENFGDAPFFAAAVPPETVAALALAVARVRAEVPDLAVGVNVLRNDARAALGIAAATGAGFVRINVHTGAAVTDQGLVEGRAAETLRERARLCPAVQLLCDVHVKHARPLGGRSLEEEAADTARRGLADALIVTGAATGSAPAADRVGRARAAGGSPVLVGSGLTADNAAELLGADPATGAAGAIVGTAAKRGGRVEQPVDPERVRALRAAFDAIRG